MGLTPGSLATVVEDALWLIIGEERHRFLPLSATEFYDEDVEAVRMKFTLDALGKPTGFTLEGAAPEPLIFEVE